MTHTLASHLHHQLPKPLLAGVELERISAFRGLGLWQAVGGAPVGSMFLPAALRAPGPSRRSVALTGSMRGEESHFFS